MISGYFAAQALPNPVMTVDSIKMKIATNTHCMVRRLTPFYSKARIPHRVLNMMTKARWIDQLEKS